MAELKTQQDPAAALTARLTLPDFLIIGAMKSGTTTLYQYLYRHPRIFRCRPKEPQYFSRDAVFERGEQWYRALFAEAGSDQLCGEASTCYSRSPRYSDAPARIKAANPQVKLIYLMRHPVERAFSHYQHEMRWRIFKKQPVLSFEEAIEQEPEIVDASYYMFQIERYLGHFDREQMLLLTLDEMRADCKAVLDRVQRFLGLTPIDLVGDAPILANEAGTALASQAWLRMFLDWRKRTRLRPLIDAIPDGPRKAVGHWLKFTRMSRLLGRRAAVERSRQLSTLTTERRQMLLDMFAEDTRRLEQFIDRDLSAWRR